MFGEIVKRKTMTRPKLSFTFDGEIKSFTDKQKLREFSTNNPAVQQMLKELSRQETQEKEKNYKKINK